MLRMENVSKSYRHRGRNVTALDGAMLEISKGDFISVVGPSPAGFCSVQTTGTPSTFAPAARRRAASTTCSCS